VGMEMEEKVPRERFDEGDEIFTSCNYISTIPYVVNINVIFLSILS
jgi:hypothetical protein